MDNENNQSSPMTSNDESAMNKSESVAPQQHIEDPEHHHTTLYRVLAVALLLVVALFIVVMLDIKNQKDAINNAQLELQQYSNLGDDFEPFANPEGQSEGEAVSAQEDPFEDPNTDAMAVPSVESESTSEAEIESDLDNLDFSELDYGL